MPRWALAVLLALWGGMSVAQSGINLGEPVPTQDPEIAEAPTVSQGSLVLRSPVLTVDPDALFAQTLFGQRVMSEVAAQTMALAAENRQIEAALTEEERSLTERRSDMDVAAFRAEADSFDERVQGIRQAQDAKERALDRIESQGREQLLTTAQPILGRLMLERGAAVVLDRRNVFIGLGAIDITEQAVAAINAELGDGTTVQD